MNRVVNAWNVIYDNLPHTALGLNTKQVSTNNSTADTLYRVCVISIHQKQAVCDDLLSIAKPPP